MALVANPGKFWCAIHRIYRAARNRFRFTVQVCDIPL